MDLQSVWKKLESEKLEVIRPTRLMPWPPKSKHPVKKLKNAYLISTGFAFLFLLGFITLFILFPVPVVRISLALVIASYIFFLVVNFSMFKKIKVDLPVDQNLKFVLRHTHDFIAENIRFQERAAFFIYPVAGTAGFLLGGTVAGADMVVLMMEKKIVIVILLVLLAILTPLCFYLARWMYKISYGTCLKELEERIHELEEV